MKTGERIKTIRKSQGITQAKLAETLHISSSFMSRIENGSSNLEFSTKLYFDTIVESLKKSCNQLYVYDNPKEFMDNIAIHKNDIVFSAIWTS